MANTRTTFTLSRRIGSTNYRVNACCSDVAAETFEDRIFRLIRNETITRSQMERYIDLLHQGEDAIKNHAPTVAERTASLLRTISGDIARERQDYRYEAMTPDEFRAELKRQQQAEREWKERLDALKKRAAAAGELSEAG